ncbi:MAG: hypothetical protein ABIQ04_01465 [Candidatus Saccharimonadales bacterium]
MTSADNNESKLFAELENSMETDLSSWRTALFVFFEQFLPLVVDELGNKLGRQVDFQIDTDRAEVCAMVRELIVDHWRLIGDPPAARAMVTASGRGIFQVYNDVYNNFDPEQTSEYAILSGIFIGFDVQAYVDPAYLDVISEGEEVSLDVQRHYQKPFGLHLVLTDVNVVDQNTYEPQAFGDKLIYLPLHYPEVTLRSISAHK